MYGRLDGSCAEPFPAAPRKPPGSVRSCGMSPLFRADRSGGARAMLLQGFVGQILQHILGVLERLLPVLLSRNFRSDGLRKCILFYRRQLGSLTKCMLQGLSHDGFSANVTLILRPCTTARQPPPHAANDAG